MAPAGELSKPDEAKVKTDLAAGREEIRMKKETAGSFPASLSELTVRFHYPADMTYDPASGEIHSRTYPQF
jgi:hypothetical protein